MPATEPAALLSDNKIDEAVAAAIQVVKRSPGDAPARLQLAECLCLSGDLPRADQHLEAVFDQAGPHSIRAATLQQLLRAATHRRECLEQGRPPELLDNADEFIAAQMKLVMALREGNPDEAAEHAATVASVAKPAVVRVGSGPIAELRDQDDAWAHTLEVLTHKGKYYWLPMSRIKTLTVYPPETATELIWPVADIEVAEGPSGRVSLPAIYPTFGVATDMPTRLGRQTDWREAADGLTLGLGLKQLWHGEADLTILELKDVAADSEALG